MTVVSALLRPFARGMLRRVQAEFNLLPVPPSDSRQQVAGPDADRVLILGNGPASGFGVSTQELGLPGQLARELATRTDRGVEVDLARGRGMTIVLACGRLELLPLWRYDAVVVTVGATDAGGLLPEHRWERDLRTLIRTIRSGSSDSVAIVVLSIRPQSSAFQGSGLLYDVIDRHASRLDDISRRVASTSDRTEYLAIGDALRTVVEERYFSPDSYRAIAQHVADLLTQPLDRRHDDGTWSEIQRRHGEDEQESLRRDAVDETDAAVTPAMERQGGSIG